MLLTGTRWEEVRDARWEDIDLERRLWLKPNPGTFHNQPRRIRLSEPAMILLRRLAKPANGGDQLFTGGEGAVPIEELWSELTAAAGIDGAGLDRLRPSLASHLFADQDSAVLNSLLGASE